IYVDFGDKVGVKKVASGRYRQPVALNIQCESSELSWQLLLSWSGTPASFDPIRSTIVTEEQAALGVQLLLDDKPFPMDEPVPINGQTSPRLEAVLVHDQSEAQLQEGSFSAKGTIKAEYQ
ncbi:fimbrial protein, partial [Aeromonas simiae]|uniref:fimbrial protein n=1 Tax=Aeromonas simiae TaxID=218936 RepID=UPI00266C7410